jgi:threonine dehydratase
VIAGTAVRTPLIRLQTDAPAEIWLKLENLQPIGSFKIRGAYNAMKQAPAEDLADGVVTASAGNMAQGVAWAARELGVPATIVAPDHIPETKRSAIERLGGRVLTVPVAEWFRAIMESRHPGLDGLFVHPVKNDRVMAGNGTIGLELLEDLPAPDAVLVPWGGGGLLSGIASAVKALRPETRIYAVEPETGAPLAASLAAGEPREFDYRPSFVDGAGATSLVPGMWEVARPLLDGSFTVSLDDAAAAVRLLAERARVVAEGAGALALAAALSGKVEGTVVCIVSGGNIDPGRLAAILDGRTPS